MVMQFKVISKFSAYLMRWNVECKTFVEYRAECAFLDVRLLFRDALAIVEQIDFNIWISQTSHIHSWEITCLQ